MQLNPEQKTVALSIIHIFLRKPIPGPCGVLPAVFLLLPFSSQLTASERPSLAFPRAVLLLHVHREDERRTNCLQIRRAMQTIASSRADGRCRDCNFLALCLSEGGDNALITPDTILISLAADGTGKKDATRDPSIDATTLYGTTIIVPSFVTGKIT